MTRSSDLVMVEREVLEIISGLSSSLRAGGPDPMDLQELSDSLERACELAHSALQSVEGGVQGSIATKQATDETAASVLSEPPEAWADCETCGGEGAINRTIHVYENGCGFSHPDVEIIPCTDCMGTGGAIVDAASTYCDICGGDCSSANPPVFNCPLAKQESCPESAPRTETEILTALEMALEWIDAVPLNVQLPAMPGFDRDWVNQVVDSANRSDTQSADHDAGNLRSKAAVGWAAWHPVHGFGQMPNAFSDIDDAIDDAKCHTILDDSPAWKAVPVEIKRVFP